MLSYHRNKSFSDDFSLHFSNLTSSCAFSSRFSVAFASRTSCYRKRLKIVHRSWNFSHQSRLPQVVHLISLSSIHFAPIPHAAGHTREFSRIRVYESVSAQNVRVKDQLCLIKNFLSALTRRPLWQLRRGGYS